MTVAAAALRDMAKTIFRQSIADCSVEHAFARTIKVVNGEDGHLLLIHGFEAIDLDRVKRIRIVAAGKASTAMLEALLARLQPASQYDLAGVLIARERPEYLPPGFQFFEGGHPLPNEASSAAAREALAMLHRLQDDDASAAETLCLFLISGGASAMMELPLDSTIPLADTVGFYRELVHSGASISEINCVRKHFSAIKGGRLAMAARGIPSFSLLISDVPPGHLDALASGPTLPDTSTVEQCRDILSRYNLLERFPKSVREFFTQDIPETPKPDSLEARAITLLTSDDLAETARMRAEELGFHVVIDNSIDDDDYRSAAEYLVDRLRGLRAEYPRVCLISSGEVTVELPSMEPNGSEDQQGMIGRGGRNQHLSLYAATLLGPSDASTVILSAGSDGIDGNSPAAGAVVDEQTLQPGAGSLRNGATRETGSVKFASPADARKALEGFDSFTFLDGLGATIITEPTGNNLRDLRILMAEQPLNKM